MAQQPSNLERLRLPRSRRFQALLDKSRRSIRSGKGLTHKEFWEAVAQRDKKNKSKRVTAEPAKIAKVR
jgi:hypothetical protein